MIVVSGDDNNIQKKMKDMYNKNNNLLEKKKHLYGTGTST